MSTNTSLQQTVAARVRAVMAARKLDLTDVSGPLGISTNALSRRLNGRVSFSIAEIEKLAHILGYSPSDFLAASFTIVPVSKAA